MRKQVLDQKPLGIREIWCGSRPGPCFIGPTFCRPTIQGNEHECLLSLKHSCNSFAKPVHYVEVLKAVLAEAGLENVAEALGF